MLRLSKPAPCRAVYATHPAHSRGVVTYGPQNRQARPENFKLWTDEAMANVCLAVERGESVWKAAAKHIVPRSTLRDNQWEGCNGSH